MANTLGNYNEIFFAQEALIQLESALGIAGRIHRDFSDDTHERGDTINIRRPGTFTVQDAPSAAQDLSTDKVPLVLSQWKEVKFKLTDKELTLTANEIIDDHIRPAAYALSNYIDQQLAALYAQIPYYTTASNPFVLDDLSAMRAAMFDRGVPLEDASKVSGMTSGAYEAFMLNKLAASGMQPNQQDSSIRNGTIGQLFGINWFANQNTPKHTSGVCADSVGALTAQANVGATTIAVNAMTAAGTLKKGDIITFAGRVDQYAVAADTVLDGAGAHAALPITPAIRPLNANLTGVFGGNVANATVVTIVLHGAAKTVNLGFHKNFATLGTAKLSTMGAELGGVRMASIAEAKSRLSIRSRMYYVGDSSAVVIALDILFGFTMLDETLAHRLVQP